MPGAIGPLLRTRSALHSSAEKFSSRRGSQNEAAHILQRQNQSTFGRSVVPCPAYTPGAISSGPSNRVALSCELDQSGGLWSNQQIETRSTSRHLTAGVNDGARQVLRTRDR